VVVEPIAEGHKVQAEIAHILYPAQVKHLKEQNLWYVWPPPNTPPLIGTK